MSYIRRSHAAGWNAVICHTGKAWSIVKPARHDAAQPKQGNGDEI
jgi:hypothetical protein